MHQKQTQNEPKIDQRGKNGPCKDFKCHRGTKNTKKGTKNETKMNKKWTRSATKCDKFKGNGQGFTLIGFMLFFTAIHPEKDSTTKNGHLPQKSVTDQNLARA